MALKSPLIVILGRLFVLLSLLALPGCYTTGHPIQGLALSKTLFSLPFDDFLQEGDVTPEAIAFCAPPECEHKLVIGSLRVHGESARLLERILQNPKLLAQELDTRNRALALKSQRTKNNKPRIDVKTQIEPIVHQGAQGFSLTMARKDGKGYIAATVLGWKQAEILHLILVIGENEEETRNTIISIVKSQLGP